MHKYILIFGTLYLFSLDSASQTKNLEKDTLNFDTFAHPKIKETYFIASLQGDFILTDFSEFYSVLDSFNVDLMNKNMGTIDVEFGGIFNNYFATFSFGYNYGLNSNHDSLDITLKTTKFGLQFGYRILNKGHFLITPKTSIKWYRYRLINNDKEKRIPINNYLKNRDLDLRINQLMGFIGVAFEYKDYNKKGFPSLLGEDFLTIGVFGGYIFKFNDNPWIHSKRNRLLAEEKISLKHFNFGFSVSVYL